jgi:hypothetical protein
MKDALKHGETAVVSYSFYFQFSNKTQALVSFVDTEFYLTQLVN